MSELKADMNADRLLQLSDEVSRIAGALAHLSLDMAAPEGGPAQEATLYLDEVSTDVIHWLIKARRARTRYVSTELFGDPAWDILLDLLRAELTQQRVSVSSVCIASGAPQTTALRYLKTMVDRGMIVRRADQHDGRRVFIELSPEVSSGLRRYLVDVVQSCRTKDSAKRAAT
jgi:hypothetical protein